MVKPEILPRRLQVRFLLRCYTQVAELVDAMPMGAKFNRMLDA